jgi:endonuclease YncB( thermonuclease family)
MIKRMIDKIREMYKQHGSNTPYFSLKGVETYARVIDVYDGDTITLVFDVNGYFLKFRCRLVGIDTCEIRSKNKENKRLAQLAKNRLFNLITNTVIDEENSKKELVKFFDDNNNIVWIKCQEFDKYGRLLVNCYFTAETQKSFSEILIEEKLAYPYDGETKLTEEEQITFLIQTQ